jgi:hypothetical protein
MQKFYLSTEEEDMATFICDPIPPPPPKTNVARKDKPVVQLLSTDWQEIRPNLECVNPLGNFDNACPSFQTLVEEVSQHTHGKYKNFVPFEELETAQPEPARIALEEISNIIKHDYLPTNVREKQGVISSAFVSPLLGFLDHELVNRHQEDIPILIMGAGTGKDIRRILQRVHGTVRIVAVEPDVKAFSMMMAAYPSVRGINATVNDALGTIRDLGPYEIIISNMSAHYIFGVNSGPLVAKTLEQLLTPTGIMYGSYVDSYMVKQSGQQQMLKTGHSVTYVGESYSDLCYGERPIIGVATIGVAGKLWQDPIIDASLLHSHFENTSLSVNVFDGHTMLFGPDHGSPIYKAPEIMTKSLNRPELSFFRCMLVAHKMAPVNTPYTMPVSLVESKSDGTPMAVALYPYNKGRALQPYESQYIHPKNTWLAEKKDGIMAKLAHNNKSLEIITQNHKSYKVFDFTSPIPDEFILQVELVPTTVDHPLVVEVGVGSYWVVVTDVLKAPWGARGSFLNRWSWLRYIYDRIKPFKMVREVPGDTTSKMVRETREWPFVLQEWATLDSIRAFEIIRDAKEGVVFQSLSAPPGSIKDGLGSARYVKRVKTMDIRQAGRIIEVEFFTGKFVKYRPDKVNPNPEAVIKGIRDAVTYDEMTAYLFYLMVGALGADRSKISENLVAQLPLSQWDICDLMWVYRNRDDPKLNSLHPQSMKFFKELFVNMACQDSFKRVVHEETQIIRQAVQHHFVPLFDDEDMEDDEHPEWISEVKDDARVPPLDTYITEFADTEEWDLNLPTIIANRRERAFKRHKQF